MKEQMMKVDPNNESVPATRPTMRILSISARSPEQSLTVCLLVCSLLSVCLFVCLSVCLKTAHVDALIETNHHTTHMAKSLLFQDIT